MNIYIENYRRITIMTIARPATRNSVDILTAQALYRAFEDFDHDDSSDVAVLTAAEGMFFAGADLKAVAAGKRRPIESAGETLGDFFFFFNDRAPPEISVFSLHDAFPI